MEFGTSLQGIIDMAYTVKIYKSTFFKYPTTHKMVPTRDTNIWDIKSETDFGNYMIINKPDSKL